MKRLCFLVFKGFIFAVSLLSCQSQLHGMDVITQCCDTCERYMKIEFLEMQFIKAVLSKVLADIDGLELQELCLQNDRWLSPVDKNSILKIIKSKIVKKYRYCHALWAEHERHQMNLLTFDELSQLQEFVRERDSYKHEPDVNQQIFARIDPAHCTQDRKSVV